MSVKDTCGPDGGGVVPGGAAEAGKTGADAGGSYLAVYKGDDKEALSSPVFVSDTTGEGGSPDTLGVWTTGGAVLVLGVDIEGVHKGAEEIVDPEATTPPVFVLDTLRSGGPAGGSNPTGAGSQSIVGAKGISTST